MRVHRDREVAFFLTEFLHVSRGDQATRTVRRLFRDWAELKLYLETCLGDGYSLLSPGNRDIGYAIDLLTKFRVPRRRTLHLSAVLGHLHGLRPSLREMNDPVDFERTIERKYHLVSNISSKDLALLYQNIQFESDDSIKEVISLLKAGVSADYLGAMPSIEAYCQYGWNEYDIYEAWKLGVHPEFLGNTWGHSGSLALMFWRKGIPLEYLKACNAAGLDAYEMMDAHAAGLPIEYALAISREEQ